MKKGKKMESVSIGTMDIANFMSFVNLHMRKSHSVILMCNVEDRTVDSSTQNALKVVNCHVFYTAEASTTNI